MIDNTFKSLNWIRTSTDFVETVVLIHGVGHDLTYWDRQIEALAKIYNVVALDLPGHGRSGALTAEWSFPAIADVMASLISHVSTDPVHLVGISFGAMIAQVLTLSRPDLVRSLTLIGSSPSFTNDVRRSMRDRADLVRREGMSAVVQTSLERWLSRTFREQRPDTTDRLTKTLLGDDPVTHAAIWAVIADLNVEDRLAEISCPTLVMVGENDRSTPPSVSARIAQEIKGSKLVIIPDAAHIVTVESPEPVNSALTSFLASLRPRV